MNVYILPLQKRGLLKSPNFEILSLLSWFPYQERKLLPVFYLLGLHSLCLSLCSKLPLTLFISFCLDSRVRAFATHGNQHRPLSILLIPFPFLFFSFSSSSSSSHSLRALHPFAKFLSFCTLHLRLFSFSLNSLSLGVLLAHAPNSFAIINPSVALPAML